MIARLLAAAMVLAACNGDDGTPLPCDVDLVLEDNCRLCHNPDLDFGAPMPLMTWEDTQAPAPSDGAVLVWESMQARVHSAGRPMPPVGTGELTAAELATLDAWFDAGAPAGEMTCE